MQPTRLSFALAAALAAAPLMAAQPAAPVQSYPVAKPAATVAPAAAPAAPAPVAAAPAGAVALPFPFVLPVAPAPAAAAGAQTPEKWLERMGDFTSNASAFKDPKTFTQWYGAMTDPAIVGATMNMMMEPGNWIRMTQSMMQPATLTNYMQFLDPSVSARWIGGMMDPNFYLQNMWSMMDPSRMMRWMMLPMDPKFMQAGINMMNPNTYMKWMMAPMDPRVWGLMFAPMNPQLYGSMAGALVNPAGMGPAWETFMRPAHPVVSLMPPAPVNVPINVLDPTTYGNMLGMFAGFLPADVQQMLNGLGGLIPGGLIPGSAAGGTGGAAAPGLPGLPAIPFFGAGANPYLQQPGAQASAAPALAQPKPTAPAVAAPAAIPAFQPGVPTKITLGGDTLFKSGKTTIKDLTVEGKAKLDELAGKIKAAGKIDTIRVIGHADPTGKASSNMTLSQKRAAAAASYLKAQGVKAGKIITAGKGDTQPVAKCDAKLPKAELIACNQPNRRVEVEVIVAK